MRRCGARCRQAEIAQDHLILFKYKYEQIESEKAIYERDTSARQSCIKDLLITWREPGDQINHGRKWCCLTLLMGLNHTLWLRLANHHNTTLCCHPTAKQTRLFHGIDVEAEITHVVLMCV